MKVKVVGVALIALMFLTSCGSKKTSDPVTESQKSEDSVLQEYIKGEATDTSSTIGGGQGTPAEEASGFRN